jgi:hypothetical protein
LENKTAAKQTKPIKGSLLQNYPNPFNSETKIQYFIDSKSIINISVYNILGQKIKTVVNKFHNAGNYHYDFNAGNLASGIYYYTLTFKGDNQEVKRITKKMIILN